MEFGKLGVAGASSAGFLFWAKPGLLLSSFGIPGAALAADATLSSRVCLMSSKDDFLTSTATALFAASASALALACFST